MKRTTVYLAVGYLAGSFFGIGRILAKVGK